MSLRLDDLIFLHGSAIPNCHARIDKHFVDYGTLQCIDRGAVDLWYNQRHWRLEPGWWWPCMPGPRIRFHPAEGHANWSHRYVAVRGPLLEAWRREGLWPEEPTPWPTGLDLPGILDGIFAHLLEGTVWGRRQAVNRLESLLLAAASARSDPGLAPWLSKARTLLAEAAIPVDVPRVASDCGMPLSTFRRRFVAATGLSPRDFALSARMDKARVRLLADRTPLATVAADLGFADSSFFIRQFRRATGMTPKAYRDSRQ